MLEGLMGALTLQTDKPVYEVGEELVFRLEGGFPDSMIAWTSYKDGEWTGEYQSAYPNQFLDAEGALTLPMGAPWTPAQVGVWEKQVISINPANSDDVRTAKAIFQIVPAGAGPAAAAGQATPSFLEKTVDVFGVQIPMLALIGAGGLALYAMTRR